MVDVNEGCPNRLSRGLRYNRFPYEVYGQVLLRTGVLKSHVSTWNVSDYDGKIGIAQYIRKDVLVSSLIAGNP